MYITKITDDYDNIIFTNCTDNENNIDIILPALFFTTPCGLSFLCLMNLMVYTFIKHFFKIKRIWRKINIQLIQLAVL